MNRVAIQEELWGGNRERLRTRFASRDSLFLYAVRSHARRRVFPAALSEPEYTHPRVLRFRRPGDVARWLAAWPVS